MEDFYIVYLKGSSKVLFESNKIGEAFKFVDDLEIQNIKNGMPYEDRYEIVKTTRRKS